MPAQAAPRPVVPQTSTPSETRDAIPSNLGQGPVSAISRTVAGGGAGPSGETASSNWSAEAEQLEQRHEVAGQLIRGASLLTRGDTSRVTLRLDPPDLGEVTIRLSTREGSLSGDITVQSRAVQEIAQRHLSALREALHTQGVQVERLQVSVDGQGPSHQDRDGFQSLTDRQASRDMSGQGGSQRRPAPQPQAPQPQPRRRSNSQVDFTA